jgi:hypothetical protein
VQARLGQLTQRVTKLANIDITHVSWWRTSRPPRARRTSWSSVTPVSCTMDM